MAESIDTDEINLLTKLCALYEKITELLPYVVMKETENSLHFALSDTFNNLFDDINTDVYDSLPDTLSKKLKGQL